MTSPISCRSISRPTVNKTFDYLVVKKTEFPYRI